MVPFAHGRWLAARIPGARAHLEPGAGDLTMTVTAIGRILDPTCSTSGAGPLLDRAAPPDDQARSAVEGATQPARPWPGARACRAVRVR